MHTDETKRKLSNYQTGRIRSEETKRLMALAKRGVQHTPEHTINHAEAMSKMVYDLTNKKTGERFKEKNLAQFAKDKGLTATNIYAVVNEHASDKDKRGTRNLLSRLFLQC